MYSRRQFGKVALAALPLPLIAGKIDSKVHGVQLGLHTYSFSGLPHEGILEVLIRSMVETGIGECILLAQQIEPGDLWEQIRSSQGSTEAQALAREKLGKWRVSVPLDYFKEIRNKFANAGIEIYGLGASPNPNASDEELRRAFEIAQTLGAKIVTLGGTISLAKRLAPIAEKLGMMVGLQGRPGTSSADPDQISTPGKFDEALSISRSVWLSLDIGDATGAGFDTFRFVQDHHDRINSLELKDRRKDRVSVPWGEGDTPVKAILQWIRDTKYPIRGFIDCDYKSAGNRADDVKRCFDYAKAALG